MKYAVNYTIRAVLLFGLLAATGTLNAQTRAYRQVNLAGSAAGIADSVDPDLLNPWGMVFLSGKTFFIANAKSGHVTAQPVAGLVVDLPGFIVGNPDNTNPGTPTGIVVDPSSSFGDPGIVQPFITATLDGGVFYWGPDTRGDIATAATLVVDHSSTGAVYTGLAILTPACCGSFLAVANFHSGAVEDYTRSFSPLAGPGDFTDPNLPVGYAPFGIQVMASQVFVTYAVQDAAKLDPVFGAGNGLVDVFDLEGNFVKRFATGGELNAPWGVAKASANFGPFSNDILIGNGGDGVINAFDPATGEFKGKVRNGDDNVIANSGLHALTFRNDGVGDPDTLYFTAGLNNGNSGLFGAISAGLVSSVGVSAPDTPNNTSATFTASVTPGPGNSGSPAGTVNFREDDVVVGTAPLVNGVARLSVTVTGVGTHTIEALYSGDATFLPGTGLASVRVTGPSTTTLQIPGSARAGSPVTLQATTTSTSGIPTGSIDFLDQADVLGTSMLNAAGVATLTISTLATGHHTLVAGYSGDRNFETSVSAPGTIAIVGGDFQLGSDRPSATVVAGQSAAFTLSITPSGGFADSVTLSCQAPGGIQCAFDHPTVNTASGPASSVLTVTTPSSSVALLHLPDFNGTWRLGLTLIAFGMGLLWYTLKAGGLRRLYWGWVTAVMFALTLALTGCGGPGQVAQPAPQTSSVVVTAQSGPISHTTTVTITVH